MSDNKPDRKTGRDTQNYAKCPQCKELYLAHDDHICRNTKSERVDRK